jgi:uncharacterized repeat protein (TIGR02543 family)
VKTYKVNVIGGFTSDGKNEYAPGEEVWIYTKASIAEFIGWTSPDVSFYNSRVISTYFIMPAKDVTVTANWDNRGFYSDIHTLYFNTNGGSYINSIQTTASTVDLSRYVPTRDGFEFAGWYADPGLTQPVTIIDVSRSDVTYVYASWTLIVPEETVPEDTAPEPTIPEDIEMPFLDVNPGDWFYSDVQDVYNRGLMNGTSSDMFSPNTTLTRGMMVTILYRLTGSPVTTETNPFSDVAAGAYYEEAVIWAAANGVVSGYDSTHFGPNDPLTREQLAAILFRYAERFTSIDVTRLANISSYPDFTKVHDWAETAVSWAIELGIIQGTDLGTIAPTASATRAQVATILNRFTQYMD